MTDTEHIAGIKCFRCGANMVFKVLDKIEGLDIKHYHCVSCDSVWYDNADVVALTEYLKSKPIPIG